MANLHPGLKKTLTDSGIPDDCPLLDYLDWAGIRTKNSLAMFFDETDKIDPWIHRFANKTTFGSPAKEIHYPEEDRRKGLLACFIAAWTECSDDLAQSRAAKLPTTSPAAPSIPPSTTPSTTDDKIPKTWPKGVYQQLLTDYKNQNSTPFPERLLLGAEKVLVRMWHEHTTSKNYQAVGLGEIITIRTFTATGSVNNNAKKDRSDKTLTIGEHNTLIQQEQKDWDPQSMMMILDSLEAIRWAWILIQISAQDTIDNYINRFVQLTRKNPQRLPNVKEAWDTFSWNIALEMRNNKSFKQATEEILQDPVTLADILSQPPKKKAKGDKGGKAKGKGKGKHKSKSKYNYWTPNHRYQPYQVTQHHNFPPPIPTTPPPTHQQQQTTPNPPPWNPPKGSSKGTKGKHSTGKNQSKSHNK